jgi:hypothetical protein
MQAEKRASRALAKNQRIRATFPSCKEFNMTTVLPETTEDDEIDKTMGAL